MIEYTLLNRTVNLHDYVATPIHGSNYKIIPLKVKILDVVENNENAGYTYTFKVIKGSPKKFSTYSKHVDGKIWTCMFGYAFTARLLGL